MNKLMKNEPLQYWLALAWLFSLTAGCTQAESNIEPQGRVESNSVEVTPVDRAEFDAALVHFRGQVVLVDCWATWCLPCVAQLSHSLQLAAELKDRDFVLATLSFDEPSKIVAVNKLLEKRGGASAVHFISKKGGGSQAMDEFGITGGSLPHYKLFDRTGKLRGTFGIDPSAKKQYTTDDVKQAVNKLVNENDG